MFRTVHRVSGVNRVSILAIVVCVCLGVLTSTSSAQISQADSRVIARVLSTDPFIIELIEEPASGLIYNPRPVVRNIKHVPEEVSQLRYGDVISASTYIYHYDAGELAIGTGFRNVRKLSKAKYDRKGFLFHYLRVTNNPNSYLTIYRDGTVLSHDTPGNYITNKVLSDRELKKLISEFKADKLDRLPSETNLKDTDPALISSLGKYQQLDLTKPSPNLKRFLDRLDALIQRYVDSATYRISYYRRFLIKDWPYESIIALDEITDTFGTAYRYKHQDRLSQIKPSASLMQETAENCIDGCVLFRHKNKLYGVNLLEACTDGTSGTWACFRIHQLSFGKIDEKTYWGYINWPTEPGLRLIDVPKDGLDIPASEYKKHREFYTRLLSGSRFMYKEGDYVYQGVNTRYR